MRYPIAILAYCFLAVSGFPQEKVLPPILEPDAYAEAEARTNGFEIFKLLPRGMFENPPDSHADHENELGVRGGGAYFSFSSRSHSYNRTPQISLEKEQLSVGFYGANYGFLYDAGKVSLEFMTEADPIAKTLASYEPAGLLEKAYSEGKKSHKYDLSGYVFHRQLNAVVGHTYLLRAISDRKADKLIAFHIFSKGHDGSLTIFWKPIKDFAAPKFLRQTDEQLREKVAKALSDVRFSDVSFEIKEDQVTLRGSVNKADYAALIQTVSLTGPFGIKNEVRAK